MNLGGGGGRGSRAWNVKRGDGCRWEEGCHPHARGIREALLVIKISTPYKAEKDSGFLPTTAEALQNWPIGTAWMALGAGGREAREGRKAAGSPGKDIPDGPTLECPGLSFVRVTSLGWALLVQ